ncbi:MAG: glycosyltransferase family 39 protein, partial [Armatimonadetes bacterium]|nr:glycosyltransferase family 39 protein [Armatimonadota bacterium]
MLPVVTITLLAFAVRYVMLTDQSIWFDEAYSLDLASSAVGQMLTKIRAEDAHPPLFYLLLRGWMKLGGTGERWVRLLPAILGTAVVPLTYLLALRLFNRRTAAVAAMLVTLSPIQIITSQQVRMYAPLTLLTLLGTLLCWEALRSRRIGLWAAYAVTMAAAGYVHYFAGLVTAAHGLYVLVWERRGILPWIAGVAGAGILFAPWMPGLLAQVQSGVGTPLWRERGGAAVLVETLGLVTFGGHLLGARGYIRPGWLAAPYVLLPALPFLLAAWYGARRARAAGQGPQAALALCASVVPLGLAFAISLARPVFMARYFTFLVPPLAVIIARGIA